MSIPTVTAARIRLGQLKGRHGEESQLSFEKFPYVGLSKTYCVDKQVADSACTATAYLCGVKGNFFTIGVNGKVGLQDCKGEKNPDNHVHSLAYWAQKAGKGTGIVTTTTVTHASPSGAYAHTSNRMWECDSDIIQSGHDPNECQDIASQLIKNTPGNKLKVILGGGAAKFIPKRQRDANGFPGERSDGQNLINLWKQNNPGGQFVYNKATLNAVNLKTTSSILGLFTPSHMAYNTDADRTKEPSLQELTETAIQLLQQEEKGYFLFVEGGRIDHGNHATKAYKALNETIELHKAIDAAVKLTSRKDTLILLTADHSHTLSIAGYPDRGNDILGLGGSGTEGIPILDNKKLPATTLAYANGPGFVNNIRTGSRVNLSDVEFRKYTYIEWFLISNIRRSNCFFLWFLLAIILLDKDFLYPTAFDATMETHAGDEVAIYATGPYSHLFSGVLEQNTIPHIVRYASCTGDTDDLTACNQFT